MDALSISSAESLVASRSWDEARELVRGFLYENPDDVDALALMGVIGTESGDQAGALKALEYCLSLGRRTVDVLEAAGCACLRLKEYPKAEVFLDEARKTDPLAASVWRNTGVLYSQTGRPRESHDAFLKARDRDPADMLTLYALASMQLYYGELPEARETLKELVLLDPPEELRQFALESLDRLAHMS